MIARTYARREPRLPDRGAHRRDARRGSARRSAIARAFEEYAVEASIAKVAGSETLDFVLDENVQIHGGNGFVKDYSAERYYRDARVNRIFEGTNEINRLLIPGMLVRRAIKGEIPLIPAARRLQDEVLSPSIGAASGSDDQVLADEMRSIAAFKKVALMIIGTAMQTYGEKLTDQQEVLGYAADILIDTYAGESAVLRAQSAWRRGSAPQRSARGRCPGVRARRRAARRSVRAVGARRPWPRATRCERCWPHSAGS